MSLKCCLFNRQFLNITSEEYNSTRKLIPLRHIDKLNTSINNMKKINVTINNLQEIKLFKSLFKLSGEFPCYISSFDTSDERLKNLDIKLGDYIIMVNHYNVSRASAKSVKKLIKKSSNKSLKLTLIRQVNNSSRSSSLYKKSNSLKLESMVQSFKSNTFKKYVDISAKSKDDNNSTSDCGYFSIPATDNHKTNQFDDDNDGELFESLSYTIASTTSDYTNSLISNDQNDIHHKNYDLVKLSIEDYLYELQNGIQIYARPCIVLEILTIQECLDLYQNVEKLIPVTRFMLNIINSLSKNTLPNAESVNIVFESYKIYLDGLPKAICLLSELTNENKRFIQFLDKIKDVYSFKVLDLLFLPLKFVQLIVEYMQNLLADFELKNDLATCEESRLRDLVNDLCKSFTKAHGLIRTKFESCFNSATDESDLSSAFSLTSDYFNSSFSSNESSVLSVYKIDHLPIQIKKNSNEWESATISVDRNHFNIKSKSTRLSSNNIVHIKKSSKCNVIEFKVVEKERDYDVDDELVTTGYKIKLENSKLKDYLFDLICKIFQKS